MDSTQKLMDGVKLYILINDFKKPTKLYVAVERELSNSNIKMKIDLLVQLDLKLKMFLLREIKGR